MAYFKARVNGSSVKEYPYIKYVDWGNNITVTDTNSSAGDLIVTQSFHAPSNLQGVELIEQWRTSSDSASILGSLYRTTGESLSITGDNELRIARFSRNSKPLNYSIETMTKNTNKDIITEEGDILAYPARNATFSLVSNVRRISKVNDGGYHYVEVIRASSSGTSTVKTNDSYALNIVRIY